MDEIRLEREAAHGTLTSLYREYGLEITDNWIEENHPVFSVAARMGEALLGAATVSCRFDRLVLDYVAVKVEARGLGLGKRLTERCLAYAREAGESALWIAAREPEFYLHLNAEETEDTALLADCRQCPDYLLDCRPKELVFYLKETS